MNKAAIYHRSESEYAYLYQENEVHLRLRTGRDVTGVKVLAGDPYKFKEEDWDQNAKDMKIVAMTEEHLYWQVSVYPPYHRLKYGFHVIGDEECFYGDRGCLPYEEAFYRQENVYFSLPYLHEIDRFKVPDWVHETVWYQIFPERFANGDKQNDPEGTLDWGSAAPTPTNFFGGDLQGVIDHLDYLESLGINGLYFCPVFKATSNHKYDTEDYYQIDPSFGTNEQFKSLVNEAHRRGMRVMIDAVFNHIGDYSPQWQDVVAKGEASIYKDWFHVHHFPVSYTKTDNDEVALDLTYDTFAFTPHMPKWNTANPEVRAYLLDVAAYWINEFDIDAWRLDVANEVDHHFWKAFHEVCLSLKDDFYILGEIWHSAQPWLQGDEFTGVMNYAYCENIDSFFNQHLLTAPSFASVLNEQLMLYQEQVNPMNLNLLDSHDKMRLKTLVNGDVVLERQMLAFMFVQPGTPCLYYGTEIGMAGGPDPDNRACMIWDEDQWDHDLLRFTKELIRLRRAYAALLSQGSIHIEAMSDTLIKVVRKWCDQSMVCYFNIGEAVTIPDEGKTLLSQNKEESVLKTKGYTLNLVC